MKTQFGIKYAAVYSENCYKLLSLDGRYNWVNKQGGMGEYDSNLGLFGQKAVTPGKPVIVVPTDLEALKLGSLGFNAICLAEPRATDDLSLSVLEDNLYSVTDTVLVWGGSTFNKRKQSLEKFLLHLSSSDKFKVQSVVGSDSPILGLRPEEISKVLDTPKLKQWKPAGILFADELLEDPDLMKAVIGLDTGFQCLDKAIGGARPGELTTVTAGSGVGKTTFLQQIAFEIGYTHGEPCGIIFLEEKPIRTVLRLASIMYKVRVDKLRTNPDILTKKQWDNLKTNPIIKKNFVFHNHFGSLDSEELFRVIDYMIDRCGVRHIFLDHISIAVSGISSKEGERKDIDILMTKLATRAVSKDVHFWIISHLSVPPGSPHEEGGRVTLSDLRGSGSIKQLSFNILALERNQQDPDGKHSLMRCLKCRETGNTGPIGVLEYNEDTGLVQEDLAWDPLEFERMLQPKARGNKQQYGGNKGYGGSTKFISDY